MKFYVNSFVVKAHTDGGYIEKMAREQIYEESELVVLVPDEMIAVKEATNRAVITPEMMAFARAEVSKETGWDIISCKMEQADSCLEGDACEDCLCP